MKRDHIIDFKNYRDVADIMTNVGFVMNHSSVRNYIIRTMRKFAQAYLTRINVEHDATMIDEVAQSSMFQQGIAELLTMLDTNYGKEKNDKCAVEKSTKDDAGITDQASKNIVEAVR